MLTTREQFNAVLSAGRLIAADAIAVLCGEDAEPRLATAVGLFVQRTARTIILSGGLDAPPRHKSAETLYPTLLGKGVAPDGIIVEPDAMNTRENAVNVVAIAREKGFRRLLIVASPYHAPRAFLAFVRALDEAQLAETIHAVSVPCAHAPWFDCPAGVELTRLGLVPVEAGKIEQYRALGHVATYARGLEYLKHWECR